MEANEVASKQRKSSQANGEAVKQMNGYASDQELHSTTFPSDCRGGGFFADQFENLANFRAHYEGTGPEIWEQTGGKLDAFIAAAGTGGTVAGVSRFLKVGSPPRSRARIILSFCPLNSSDVSSTGKELGYQMLPR